MTATPAARPRPRRPLLSRIPPPVMFTLMLAGTIAVARFLPGPLLWAWPTNLAGAVLMLAGLVLAVGAVMAFRRAGVSPRLFEGGPQVVSHGPFSRTRNPMYLSLIVTLAGAATVMGHVLPYAGPVLLFLWFDRVFVPREEAVLAAHFGPDWSAYTTRVRRWV
ncbi:hypothetical protein F1188_04600 [Roseospira marina]|uniref:Isoprenylcysteine carboxylmethyltransferase family protein n=1 Tax=Roseospira marina TaxID=140057 RepID=A0A5M6IEE0_9PROT|nr:methyltransferase [Roseospira marina]KAA5606623.1 hypothetical protein F1188_04600 [Roseospira marina]MBB4313974.1 protein-S-isoprenylcysteine O-methyltransferase Ste14 [Roseospira marina]MBB5087136.1 protein-S-isoprenylcysteine O-methyltransferase Ste14 [Roseospira marina]